MRISFLIPALFVTFIAAKRADAYNWVINGASCVPGDPAIQNNRYLDTGGSTTFQSGATGLITLYCPISAPDIMFTCTNNLYVTYADTDGTGTSTNITAQLIRLSYFNGGFATVGGSLNSNSYGYTSGGSMSRAINHCFSGFDYYYVRIDLNRSSTSYYSTLFGVSIRS